MRIKSSNKINSILNLDVILYTIWGVILMSTYIWIKDIIVYIFRILPNILDKTLYNRLEPILSQYAFKDTVVCSVLIIVYILYYKFRKNHWKNEDKFKLIYFRKADFKDIISGLSVVLAGGAVSFTWIVIVNYLSTYIPFLGESLKDFSEQGNMFVENNWYIFTLLSVAILGPIVEELLVRGLILGEMQKKVPIALAIILNGLIFGVFHGNFVQVVYSAIIGIAYAFVYYYTESFILICAMHIFNNLKEVLPSMPKIVSDNITIGLLVIGYICIIPAFFAMKYLYKKYYDRHRVNNT